MEHQQLSNKGKVQTGSPGAQNPFHEEARENRRGTREQAGPTSAECIELDSSDGKQVQSIFVKLISKKDFLSYLSRGMGVHMRGEEESHEYRQKLL